MSTVQITVNTVTTLVPQASRGFVEAVVREVANKYPGSFQADSGDQGEWIAKDLRRALRNGEVYPSRIACMYM